MNSEPGAGRSVARATGALMAAAIIFALYIGLAGAIYGWLCAGPLGLVFGALWAAQGGLFAGLLYGVFGGRPAGAAAGFLGGVSATLLHAATGDVGGFAASWTPMWVVHAAVPPIVGALLGWAIATAAESGSRAIPLAPLLGRVMRASPLQRRPLSARVAIAFSITVLALAWFIPFWR